jgi:hypothetical protein
METLRHREPAYILYKDDHEGFQRYNARMPLAFPAPPRLCGFTCAFNFFRMIKNKKGNRESHRVSYFLSFIFSVCR